MTYTIPTGKNVLLWHVYSCVPVDTQVFQRCIDIFNKISEMRIVHGKILTEF